MTWWCCHLDPQWPGASSSDLCSLPHEQPKKDSFIQRKLTGWNIVHVKVFSYPLCKSSILYLNILVQFWLVSWSIWLRLCCGGWEDEGTLKFTFSLFGEIQYSIVYSSCKWINYSSSLGATIHKITSQQFLYKWQDVLVWTEILR